MSSPRSAAQPSSARTTVVPAATTRPPRARARAIAGLEVERVLLPPGAGMTGIPHTPGAREYLTCERGEVELSESGRLWRLAAGDVVVFRGDQSHGYRNPGREPAIAYRAGADPRVRPLEEVRLDL